jgi:hypothetical protein
MGYPECGQPDHVWRRIGSSSWDAFQELVPQLLHGQIGTNFDLDQIVEAHPRMEAAKSQEISDCRVRRWLSCRSDHSPANLYRGNALYRG